MTFETLKSFLDDKVELYNQPEFITTDPIQIPHQFQHKQDIEIAGFLTATIAWGNRKSILKNGEKLLQIMDYSPHDFILNHTKSDLKACDGFVHRTFNSDDLTYFLTALKTLYHNYDSLEEVFAQYLTTTDLQESIHHFKHEFFSLPHQKRTEKHVSDPLKKSAAKRINMYLRWLVRQDQKGVDFGLWTKIKPSALSCPLDVHSGRVARKLGLLNRKQNDAKAVRELDSNLKKLDPIDPIKYDFALFGLGVFEAF